VNALASLLALEETPLATKPRRVGKARKGSPKESEVQRTILSGMRHFGFRALHIPNGAYFGEDRRRAFRQGAKLKLDGAQSGTPDLLLTRPQARGGPEMAWMEIKKEGGTVSPAQIEFGQRCTRDGIKWAVVTSLDDALAVLRRWGWL
jgi:hypothetical protein